MVHCRHVSPYLSFIYPKKGDYSSRGGGDYNALGGYTRRRRDIDRIDAGIV